MCGKCRFRFCGCYKPTGALTRTKDKDKTMEKDDLYLSPKVMEELKASLERARIRLAQEEKNVESLARLVRECHTGNAESAGRS